MSGPTWSSYISLHGSSLQLQCPLFQVRGELSHEIAARAHSILFLASRTLIQLGQMIDTRDLVVASIQVVVARWLATKGRLHSEWIVRLCHKRKVVNFPESATSVLLQDWSLSHG